MTNLTHTKIAFCLMNMIEINHRLYLLFHNEAVSVKERNDYLYQRPVFRSTKKYTLSQPKSLLSIRVTNRLSDTYKDVMIS